MNRTESMQQKKMNMNELHDLFRNGLSDGEIILDVRDEDEFAEGHVPGSLNIPHDRVLDHLAQLAGYRRIYVHCGGGGRAGKAVAALEGAGLSQVVHICESGMRSWVAAGYPIAR